jgi:hypothetical protein
MAAAVVTGVAGCEYHNALSRPGTSSEQAVEDIAQCRREAETTAGPAPLRSQIYSLEWSERRERLLALCLQGKGYQVRRVAGPCTGDCLAPGNPPAR